MENKGPENVRDLAFVSGRPQLIEDYEHADDSDEDEEHD